jgi:hypothetical protein
VCEHNSAERFYSYFRAAAGVKLRKRWIDGSATSNPESFLRFMQKRFGTPAGFNRARVHAGAARVGYPP